MMVTMMILSGNCVLLLLQFASLEWPIARERPSFRTVLQRFSLDGFKNKKPNKAEMFKEETPPPVKRTQPDLAPGPGPDYPVQSGDANC